MSDLSWRVANSRECSICEVELSIKTRISSLNRIFNYVDAYKHQTLSKSSKRKRHSFSLPLFPSDLKLSTSNGYWTLRSIEIKAGEYKRSRDQTFREVDLSFFIGRRPTHFVVFSIVPCMIIGMLVLVSFFIPAESGERIGLCATILLAVSVYLLVVTEQLPEQSETLPLIGVYYIVIMFEIGLALAATVLVLMAHHATSEPPRYLAYITG